jgi:hypothetical protein
VASKLRFCRASSDSNLGSSVEPAAVRVHAQRDQHWYPQALFSDPHQRISVEKQVRDPQFETRRILSLFTFSTNFATLSADAN